MVQVALHWVLVAACLLPLGSVVLRLLAGGQSLPGYLTSPFVLAGLGLALITTAANVWAYLFPVNGLFLALVVLAAALSVLRSRSLWRTLLAAWGLGLRSTSWWIRVLFLFLFAIAAFKSAAPSEMFDEGGYYLPYIKWIEQYRIVPGIANIEDRIGFNSSVHMSQAVFGLAGLLPGGAYDLNGLLLVLFSLLALSGLRDLIAGRITASAVARTFGLLYLMRNMLTAASADLPNILLGQAIVVLALQRMEAGEARSPGAGFRVIGLLSVFLFTIKLSSLFLALVPLVDLGRFLWQGIKPRLGALAAASLLVVLPWLGRSPILSGYLVYPLYSIDLFHVDWKVPEEIARRQYFYVSEFAKTNAPPEESEDLNRARSLSEWVPRWFKRENTINRAMILCVPACMLVLALTVLVRRRSLSFVTSDQWLLLAVLTINIVLWFLRNPAMRFGWAWMVQFVALSVYVLLRAWRLERWSGPALAVLIIAVVGSATLATAREERTHFPGNLLRPASTAQVAHRSVMLQGGLPANIAAGPQCWGIDPPCLKKGEERKVEARGAHVEDGFRSRRRTRRS